MGFRVVDASLLRIPTTIETRFLLLPFQLVPSLLYPCCYIGWFVAGDVKYAGLGMLMLCKSIYHNIFLSGPELCT